MGLKWIVELDLEPEVEGQTDGSTSGQLEGRLGTTAHQALIVARLRFRVNFVSEMPLSCCACFGWVVSLVNGVRRPDSVCLSVHKLCVWNSADVCACAFVIL